jgi:peptidoglycan/LPS O-acetylase OafA/YrhL
VTRVTSASISEQAAPPAQRAETTTGAPVPSRPVSGTARMAWLDVLRGLAALAVVYTHFSREALPGLYRLTSAWWQAGAFGVGLFFLISGYIVPASLERHGSVRSFWISRFARLYPLWIAAVVAVYALNRAHVRPLTAAAVVRWKQYLLAHLTMLQELIRVDNYINVMWTLSLEMAFYFMVVALYAAGLHRRSSEVSAGFAIASLAGILAGFHGWFFMRHLGVNAVLVGVTAICVTGLALSLTGQRPLVLAGAVLLGTTGLLLLVLNQEPRTWYFLLLPATMFAGTALSRADRGEIPRWKASVAVSLLAAIAIVNPTASAVHGGQPLAAGVWAGLTVNRSWILTIGAVAAAFTLGRALRNRKMPRVLALLGVMSYSTYLLHPLIHQTIMPRLAGKSAEVRVAVFALWWVALFSGAYVTYRLIELPAQRAGRRIIKWADRRFGADTSVRREA